MRCWFAWWASLALLSGIAVLTACTQQVSPVSSFCPQPIHPDSVTRAWLATLNPPSEANHYFNLIDDQQKAIEKACSQ